MAHDLALQGLVCYTFCGGRRRKGLAEGQRKGLSATPGQAGFAGRMAENTGACEKQSPPGRQRMCGLEWSGATGKHAQPRRRRYIKTLVSRLSFSTFSIFRAIAFLIFWFLGALLFLDFCGFRSKAFYANSFSNELSAIPFFEKCKDRF